ncbi:MAG: SWIM zinc finger family protein [Caldilineaceae bacterium]|nr:SWIM zinc finger family protein [Caldilineaceae bacterium]
MNTTNTSTLDRSALMATYNRARSNAAAAAGIDRARTNRALGILQRGELEVSAGGSYARCRGSNGETYRVTTRECTCPDHQRRGVTCKHITAFMIHIRATEATPQPDPLTDNALADNISLLYGG